jgi:molybdopterin converting factor small subunit
LFFETGYIDASAAKAASGRQVGKIQMNISVQIPSVLRRHTGGAARVSCAASNLNDLFCALGEQFPDLKPHLRDESGQIRRFLNVYVNEEDVRFLGGASYAFKDGDEILLLPSIAGGRRPI